MGVGGVEGEGEEEGVDVNVVVVVVVDAFRGLKKKFHLIFTFSVNKKMLRCQTTSRFRTFCLVWNHFRNFLLFSKLFLFKCRKVFLKVFFLFFAFLKFKCQLRETRATIFKLNLSFQIFWLIFDFWFFFNRSISLDFISISIDRKRFDWSRFRLRCQKTIKIKTPKIWA